LLAVHSFDDDHGLSNIVSSCNDMMQRSNQLVAKTEQYLGLKHSSVTETSDTGNSVFHRVMYVYKQGFL